MDVDKFLVARLDLPEAEVPVPELSNFFGPDEKPVWVVRGLSGPEIGRTRAAAETSEKLSSLVEALAGEGDKAEAIRNAMGLSPDEVPEDVARRIEMLVVGSVSPVIGNEKRDIAVKLAESYGVVFYTLTNKIQQLTGQGSVLGKPKASGGKKTSG